jgi:3'(2'), 5'-bisphosphate nucleotidase
MPGSDVNDAHVSVEIAQQAGRLLLELRAQFVTEHGPDLTREQADRLRDLADTESHTLIARFLAEARPDDALLSEEGKDDATRLEAARVWIVDPVDGTWEFGQIRSDFAVHIALWDTSEQRLSACTVDLPGQGLTRSVLDAEPGVHPIPTDRPIRIVASQSRPPETLGRIVDDLSVVLAAQGMTQGVEVVDVGSVGAKVNEVLAGRAEAYVHNTGFYEWDVAAPYGVALHYGLVSSHFDGSPVTFNHMPPYVTDFAVAHPDIAAALRSVLRT